MSKDSKTPSKPVTAAQKPGSGVDPVKAGEKPVTESPAKPPVKTPDAGDKSAVAPKAGAKPAGSASAKSRKAAPKAKSGADASKPVASENAPTPASPVPVAPATPVKVSAPVNVPISGATAGAAKSAGAEQPLTDAAVTAKVPDSASAPVRPGEPPATAPNTTAPASPEIAPPAVKTPSQATVEPTGASPHPTADQAPPPANTVTAEPKASRPPIAPEPVMPEPWSPEAETPPAPAPEPEWSPPPQPSRPSLFIVHVSPELAPVAKVGGLADVVFGLCREMELRGNHVEIILPKYDCLRYDHIYGLQCTFEDLWVPWYGGAIHCSVYFGFVHGRKCFFIEPHSQDNFFNRGAVYGFNDDLLRFAFFSRAAVEFMWKSGKHPDVIHCHDWQTALVPVLLYEIYQRMGMSHPRTCFTIHNFKHQGVTGAEVLSATGLNRPDYYFHYDRLRDNQNPAAINLMKGGIVYSNFVTTVSPRYATEAKDQGQGFGLEPTLHIHHVKYGGVVNGIDYEVWNPEIDPVIPVKYSVDTLDRKYDNKRALRSRLLLADNEKPIVAFVGRLDPQKGIELIRHSLFFTLAQGGQFVLLGSSPDNSINAYFWGLKHQFNDNPDVHLEIGYNEELAHLIYAGADMTVVPSRFEPCGLIQLIAMRYGTIPVVREIGGLADTVVDKDFSHRPLHERTGYLFRDYDEAGLESGLGRAIACYYQYPEHFRELMKNAMRCDWSWNHPGQDYLNIYDLIREK